MHKESSYKRCLELCDLNTCLKFHKHFKTIKHVKRIFQGYVSVSIFFFKEELKKIKIITRSYSRSFKCFKTSNKTCICNTHSRSR